MTANDSENIILNLHCHGVTYGEKIVLRPFHLRINKGQHIAVIGASGVGKSTLLKVIFDHCKTTVQKTAFIPQHLGLVENLSAFHNVYIGRLDQYSTLSNLINLAAPRFSSRKEIKSILDRLSLGNKLFSVCGELSGGQQQRIAIARAVYRQAPVLIADEPLASLDQQQAEIAFKLMIDHHASSIIALHNTAQAMHYCDRIIGIADGNITLDAPTAQLNSQDLAAIYQYNRTQ